MGGEGGGKGWLSLRCCFHHRGVQVGAGPRQAWVLLPEVPRNKDQATPVGPGAPMLRCRPLGEVFRRGPQERRLGPLLLDAAASSSNPERFRIPVRLKSPSLGTQANPSHQKTPSTTQTAVRDPPTQEPRPPNLSNLKHEPPDAQAKRLPSAQTSLSSPKPNSQKPVTAGPP